MKKSLSLILALLLTLVMAAPAWADDVSISAEGDIQGGTTLTYEVDPSFTVTIPDAVSLSKADGTGSSTVKVSAGVLIPFGEVLTVKVSSAQYGDSSFRLKTAVTDDYLKYTIKLGAATEALANNATVLTISEKNAADTTVTLNYAAETPTKSGEYTDKLTFTVAVGTPAP